MNEHCSLHPLHFLLLLPPHGPKHSIADEFHVSMRRVLPAVKRLEMQIKRFAVRHRHVRAIVDALEDCCSVLQCVAVCRSVLRCVAVRYQHVRTIVDAPEILKKSAHAYIYHAK